MVQFNMSENRQKHLSKSLERILEEASLSGELKLCGQKLKEFPIAEMKIKSTETKFSLKDTVIADLSKNRFIELPEELLEFSHLEQLHLYHNTLKNIPKSVILLQSLTFLNLSRNQLTILPREICRLPLHSLLVAHNKLVSLPDQLGRMSVLVEFDASCNEIKNLPRNLEELSRLKYLNLRSNFLEYIPIELTFLKLIKLDLSKNRITVLPDKIIEMKSLVYLEILDNPLISPPAELCIQGRVHIFKYLETFKLNPDCISDGIRHRFRKTLRCYENLTSLKDYKQNRQNIHFEKNLCDKKKKTMVNGDSSDFSNYVRTQDYILSFILFVIFILTLSLLFFNPIPA